MFTFLSADLHMEENTVKAPPGHTNYVILRIVQSTPSTTERSSVLSLTANSSEDGTTPGDHTLEWMVRHVFPELLRKTQSIGKAFDNQLMIDSIWLFPAISLIIFFF